MRGAVIAVVLLWSSFSYGARGGVTVRDQVEIYDSPSSSAILIEKIPKDTEVAASNYPVEGFHKVRILKGTVGWIKAEDLQLQPVPPGFEAPPARVVANTPPPLPSPSLEPLPLPVGSPPSDEAQSIPKPSSASAEKPRKKKKALSEKLRISGFGTWNLIGVTGVIKNFDGPSSAFGFGGSLSFPVSERLSLDLRVESIFSTSILQDDSTAKTFQVDVGSLPVMAGTHFLLAQTGKFEVRLGVFFGVGLSTRLSSTDQSDTAPPDVVAEVVSPIVFTALGVLDMDLRLSNAFSVFAEVGYRYLTTSELSAPAAPNNGALILNSTFSLNLSSPVISAGASLRF